MNTACDYALGIIIISHQHYEEMHLINTLLAVSLQKNPFSPLPIPLNVICPSANIVPGTCMI